MRPLAAATFTLAGLLLVASAAAAQESQATKDYAAQKATQKAEAVTLQLRDMMHGGTNIGSVRLQPIGRTQTRVSLHLTAPHTVVTLHRGSDCSDPRYASAASAIALNPVANSQPSETIVNLPLTDLNSGNYLLDVRNATQTAEFEQACARLSR